MATELGVMGSTFVKRLALEFHNYDLRMDALETALAGAVSRIVALESGIVVGPPSTSQLVEDPDYPGLYLPGTLPEDPDYPGLYLTSTLTEDPSNPGLYLIGA